MSRPVLAKNSPKKFRIVSLERSKALSCWPMTEGGQGRGSAELRQSRKPGRLLGLGSRLGRQFPQQVTWLLLGMLFFCLLSGTSSAIVQPRFYDWQCRLNRLIPESDRQAASKLATSLPLETDSQKLQEAVASLPLSIYPKPVQLFVGINVLLRQDKVSNEATEQEETFRLSTDILQAYIVDLQHMLKAAPLKDDYPAPELADPASWPAPSTSAKGVTALRYLPYPPAGASRHTIGLYLDMARADKMKVEELQQEFSQKLLAMRQCSSELRRYLWDLSNSLSPLTGLELPKSSQGKNRYSEGIELIVPQPPFDLQPIKTNSKAK